MKAHVIYADPPWKYDNERDNDPAAGGMTYATLHLQELRDLPVGELAGRDCALFLWATMPKLREALACIDAWGFTYTTCAFVWVKLNPTGRVIELVGSHLLEVLTSLGLGKVAQKALLLLGGIYSGMGHWTNQNCELVLLAKRGSPKRVRKDVKSVVLAPRGRHSAKPKEVHARIVALMGDVPRVELFARERVDGWISLGNEIDRRDIRDSLCALIAED